MKQETRIILSALRNFLDRPEVKSKTVVATMPKDVRLGDLAGKDVDIPLTSVFQGLLHKVSFKEMADVLDANNDVVIIFIEELVNGLKGYVPPIESVPFKVREQEVKDISSSLKGDVDDKDE